MSEQEPRSLEPTIPQEVLPYTPEDIQHWQQRAGDYRHFLTTLSSHERQELFASERPLSEDVIVRGVGDERYMQALFLGEKPMVNISTDTPYSLSLREKLAQYDLEVHHGFIVDRNQLDTLIRSKQKFFERYHITSTDEALERMGETHSQEQEALMGVMLGYPQSAAEDYEAMYPIPQVMRHIIDFPEIDTADKRLLQHTFELGLLLPEEESPFPDVTVHESEIIPLVERYGPAVGLQTQDIKDICDKLPVYLNAQGANVHGITWLDFKPSQESIHKQARLKAAFETSGILDIQ